MSKRGVAVLTGFVGCGKTAIANMFKKLGANVIDADEIGHKLLTKKEIKQKVLKNFKGIATKGKINRKKLGNIVFNDYKELKKLDKIMHPALIKGIKKKIKKNKVNIIDAALLKELKLRKIADKIILVKASKKNILKRTKNKKRLKKILRFQKEPKRADFVINNNKTIKQTKAQVKKIWQALK